MAGLATTLGFSTMEPSDGAALLLNPSTFLTGDPGLDSFLGIKALKMDCYRLIRSVWFASAAAAALPLSLLRSRPRRSSSFLGAGFAFSFLGADLEREGCLLGAAFLGGAVFLTLFDLAAFVSFFLVDFAGDFEV